MRVIVDLNKCEHYGQCVFAAPDVFQLNGEAQLEWQNNPDASQRDKVAAAVDVCPMQAISVEE
jgi:ferredoxin